MIDFIRGENTCVVGNGDRDGRKERRYWMEWCQEGFTSGSWKNFDVFPTTHRRGYLAPRQQQSMAADHGEEDTHEPRSGFTIILIDGINIVEVPESFRQSYIITKHEASEISAKAQSRASDD